MQKKRVSTTDARTSICPKCKYDKHEVIICFAMIALPIIGFLVFQIYPILWTFRWAWYSYDGVPSHTRYIGFENFVRLFTIDFTYWKTWANTLLFTICKIPIELPIAMLLALLLNKKTKLKGFFRAAYYMPCVVSVVIVGLVFSNMFSYTGLVNTWLIRFGIIKSPIDFFATKFNAMLMLVLGSVWCSFGVNVMYFVAALSNVPEALYESATLDGASKLTQFFKITLPSISPVFKVILMLSIVGTLGVNEYILVLTGGAPSGQTITVMSYLTKTFVPGFMESGAVPPLGYGCAMSLMTTIIFAIVGLSYNKISNKIGSDE